MNGYDGDDAAETANARFLVAHRVRGNVIWSFHGVLLWCQNKPGAALRRVEILRAIVESYHSQPGAGCSSARHFL